MGLVPHKKRRHTGALSLLREDAVRKQLSVAWTLT